MTSKTPKNTTKECVGTFEEHNRLYSGLKDHWHAYCFYDESVMEDCYRTSLGNTLSINVGSVFGEIDYTEPKDDIAYKLIVLDDRHCGYNLCAFLQNGEENSISWLSYATFDNYMH